MFETFKLTIKQFFGQPGVWVWTLLFPIILSTLFMSMFSTFDNMANWSNVKVAVLQDENYEGSGFEALVNSLSEEGESQLLEPSYVETKEEGNALVKNQSVEGLFTVGEDGVPSFTVMSVSALGDSTHDINATILSQICDAYVQNSELVRAAAKENPLLFANPESIKEALDQPNYTESVSLTENAPKASVRYYYALLGLAAVMGSSVAMMCICKTQPNLSAVGARRALGRQSRLKTLVSVFLASWALQFACLRVGFLYIRFVAGVDFGGKDGLCVLGMLVASLMSCALGTIIGAIPKMSEGAKGGLVAGISCFLALFAGLYGQPCMRLADDVAANFPLAAKLNPVKVITDMFYSLYYYDSLGPFYEAVLILVAFSLVFLVIAAVLVRKQRYEYV